jgi:NitT/TauT family transport system substrate-binding protein
MAIIKALMLCAFSIFLTGTASAKPINVAYSAITGSQAPLWVAKQEHIFQKNGLDVELVYIGGGSIVTNALLTGDVQFARLGANAVLQASIRGADLKIIANTMNTLVTYMMVRPEIKTLKDLKGKKIGVTRFGGNVDYALDLLLKKEGLQRGKDVIVLQTGGNPQLVGSLKAGSVDAGILSSPTNLQAARLGMKELFDFSDLGIAYPASIIAANHQYLVENSDTVLRFMRAYCEGIHRVLNDPKATMKAIARYSGEKDQEILAEVYRVYGVKHLERIPYVRVDGVQEILRSLNMTATDANAKSFIDNGFVSKLEQEGFFQKLYKSSREN